MLPSTARSRLAVLLLVLLTACGGGGAGPDASPDAPPLVPTMNWDRDLLSMDWTVDVTARHATATITLAPSDAPGASFEIGDLMIAGVRDSGDIAFAASDGRLDLAVPASTAETTVSIEYDYLQHDAFDGAMSSGLTLLWPYYCGNLFPCKSVPDDGLHFTMSLTGVPADEVAVYPQVIPGDAPSYMPAWAIGDYTYLDLGATTAGTSVGVWYLPGGEADATAGTANLRAVFEWLETTYGAYLFGDTVASVSAPWGAGAFGGMEHHPLWHVATGAMSSEEVHAHEAAHGWFGNAIRIACWEDFVLSEGFASYLAVRALEAVAGTTVSDPIWASYGRRLARVGAGLAWPDSCGTIDILEDDLFTDAPYMKGAHFLRALENRVGRTELDAAIGAFYVAHRGGAARMQDLLDAVEAATGYDPDTCATAWLRGTTVPTEATCP